MNKKSLTTLVPTNGKVSGQMLVKQGIMAHHKKLATVKSTIDNKPPKTMRIKSASVHSGKRILNTNRSERRNSYSGRDVIMLQEDPKSAQNKEPLEYEDLIDKDKKKFTEAAPFTPRILKSKTKSKLVADRKIYNPTKVPQKINKNNNNSTINSRNGNSYKLHGENTARSTNSDHDFRFNDDFELRNGLSLNTHQDPINDSNKEKVRQDLCFKFLGDVAGEISAQKISSVKGMKQVMEQNMRQNKYNMTKNELSESYNMFLKDLDPQNPYSAPSPVPPTNLEPHTSNNIPDWIRQTQNHQDQQDLPHQTTLDYSMSSISASIKPTPAYANHSAAPDYFQTSLHSLDETTDEINLIGAGGVYKELTYENKENKIQRQNSDFSNGIRDTIELREYRSQHSSTDVNKNIEKVNNTTSNHQDYERNTEDPAYRYKDEVDLKHPSPQPNRNVRFASTNDEFSPNHSLTDISSIQPDNNYTDDDYGDAIKHDDDYGAYDAQLTMTQPESYHMSQQLDESVIEQYKKTMTIKDYDNDDGYEDDFEDLEESNKRIR